MSAREVTRACVAALVLIVTAALALGVLFVAAVTSWAVISVYPLFALTSFVATAAVGGVAVRLHARHTRRIELTALRHRFDTAPMLWP